MRQSRSGFTLIELIFVIVIIGLLAAVAVPRFITTEQNAKIKPALEVADQVVNKVTERYKNIQDAYVNDAVKSDKDIMQYLGELTTNIDKHFNWDTNETVFQINYDPSTTVAGNTVTSSNTPVNTTNDTIDTKGALCVRVKRWAIQVPVTIDANVTQYDYNVSDVNVSCITAAH